MDKKYTVRLTRKVPYEYASNSLSEVIVGVFDTRDEALEVANYIMEHCSMGEGLYEYDGFLADDVTYGVLPYFGTFGKFQEEMVE